jgi:hypothetical protein
MPNRAATYRRSVAASAPKINAARSVDPGFVAALSAEFKKSFNDR